MKKLLAATLAIYGFILSFLEILFFILSATTPLQFIINLILTGTMFICGSLALQKEIGE